MEDLLWYGVPDAPGNLCACPRTPPLIFLSTGWLPRLGCRENHQPSQERSFPMVLRPFDLFPAEVSATGSTPSNTPPYGTGSSNLAQWYDTSSRPGCCLQASMTVTDMELLEPHTRSLAGIGLSRRGVFNGSELRKFTESPGVS
eukprot:761002-Hanusia_phi.AAC.1